MSTILFIHPDVQDQQIIISSLLENITIGNYNELCNLNITTIDRIGLMFHNIDNNCVVPFLNTSQQEVENEYKYWSSDLIKIFSTKNNLYVDVVSCNMNLIGFIDETTKINHFTNF